MPLKILLLSLLSTASSTGQGEAEGGQVEGLYPEEVPVEEEAGDPWGRRRAEGWVAAPAGRVCAGWLVEEHG